MPRYKLVIEYDGAPFRGWQRQADDPTVQAAIETAVTRFSGETARLTCAGRTDAGVHAIHQVAHLDLARDWRTDTVRDALNAHLRPAPISILDCRIVPDDWHSRFSCIGRAYQYRIVNRRAPLTVERNRAWQVIQKLDADAMHDAAQLLVGLHDFTTFRSAHCQSESPIKSLDRLDVRREGEHVIVEAAARSFLHHQVRSMVGSLAAVGTGRWSADDLKVSLEAKDRNELALNAPPEGLYFVKAVYP